MNNHNRKTCEFNGYFNFKVQGGLTYKEANEIPYNYTILPEYIFQDEKEVWSTFQEHINQTLRERRNGVFFNPITLYNNINSTEGLLVPLDLKDEQIIYSYLKRIEKNIREIIVQNSRSGISENSTIQSLLDSMGLTEEQRRITLDVWNYINDPELPGNIKEIIEDEKRRQEKVQKNCIREEKYEKQVEKYKENAVQSSKFIIQKIVKVYKITDDTILGNIYDLFNRSRVSDSIFLITTFRFYKILKGKNYNLETPPRDDMMYLFVKGRKETENIKVEVSTKQITFSYDIGKDDKEFVLEICNCLGINPESLVAEKEKFNGICFYRGQLLNNVIWSDIVTNNSIVSKKLIIDEYKNVKKAEQAQKPRKGIFMYYFFGNDPNDTITLSIREYVISSKKEREVKAVRLRIMNATSMSIVDKIKEDIGIYLNIYNTQGRQIADDYNNLLQQNRIKYEPPQKLNLEFSYPSGYTRKCAKPPQIIGKNLTETVEELEEKYGRRVMRYPKQGSISEQGIELDSYDFICKNIGEEGEESKKRKKETINYSKSKFPGLKINYEPNRDGIVEPLLPCCYEKDNLSQKNKITYKYYIENKTIEQIVKEEEKESLGLGGVIITNRFVSQGQYGKCPETIEKLVSLYTNQKVERLGVHDTKSSFLECVLTEIDFDNFSLKTSSQQIRTLQKELDNISKYPNLSSICAQECWDITNPKEEISKNKYFNPQKFIKIVETIYDCRIVLFERDEISVEFLHPDFIQGYLRWKPTNNKIILIYQHRGIESEYDGYPRCELIKIKEPNEQNIQFIHSKIYDSWISSLITIHGKQLTDYLSQESLIQNLTDRNFKLVSQHIDYYGKVYAYNVLRDNQNLTLFLLDTRLPPMNIPKTQEVYFSNQVEWGDRKIGNNKIVIDCTNTLGYSFYFLEKKVDVSELTQFSEQKIQLELLIENAKHIYSKQENKNSWDFIKIGRPRVYNQLLFDGNNYVIVPSEEIKKRLQYVLTLYGIRKKYDLELYKNYTTIPRIYEESYDFDKQDNCIILEIDSRVEWYQDLYTVENYKNRDFTTFVNGMSLYCEPISKEKIQQDNNYILYFPQDKKIFTVVKNVQEQQNKYLFFKTSDMNYYYKCTELEMMH